VLCVLCSTSLGSGASEASSSASSATPSSLAFFCNALFFKPLSASLSISGAGTVPIDAGRVACQSPVRTHTLPGQLPTRVLRLPRRSIAIQWVPRRSKPTARSRRQQPAAPPTALRRAPGSSGSPRGGGGHGIGLLGNITEKCNSAPTTRGSAALNRRTTRENRGSRKVIGSRLHMNPMNGRIPQSGS